MTSGPAQIVWFRRDLRLTDNDAICAAASTGGPIIPTFVWAPDEDAPGAASRWWLHHSLESLSASLERKGSRLLLRTGPSATTLVRLARETGARAIHYGRLHKPGAAARDNEVERALRDAGIEVFAHPASLLLDPRSVANKTGNPFQVFTPFWRRCMELIAPEAPAKAPRSLSPYPRPLSGLALDDLGLLPRVDWARGFRELWQPGEEGARKRLDRFVARSIGAYEKQRDLPAIDATSRLSPHLHFGEISPRQVWHAAHAVSGAAPFLRQLGWREFAHHLLHHFPRTVSRPLRPEFDAFPWGRDPRLLKAWQEGLTGYPIVDAGMRELWTTGWMHNRVRMIAASFLVKDLLIPWQDGAAWFHDTLVDADLANNTLGWQWVAGCGADAAPYFRIFNPVLQGRKFDPDGKYVRRWVPELVAMPDRWIHEPFEAPSGALEKAGVRLGQTYPKPIVNHDEARDRALEAYAFTRNRSARH